MKRKAKRRNRGIEAAIEVVGSQTALAKLMRVKQPAVNHWLFVHVTPERAIQIERKCGVSRELICPEIFG